MNPDAATRAHLGRVLVVFDFDETLAGRTTDALVRHLGLEPDTFEVDHVTPRVEAGWEKRLAEAAALVELSRGGDLDHTPITSATFAAVADSLDLYPGVDELFDRLTAVVERVDPGIEIEFHLLTAGFVDVPSATRIADRFTSIRGGHWAYDDDGAICFPASTLGHYAKVRHLLALSKGLDSTRPDAEVDPGAPVDEHRRHAPFEQIVFVGDGDSDLPSYELMRRRAGTAIAVHQADDAAGWESADDMRRGREVTALFRSDYSEGSPLLGVLCDAVERAALHARMTAANHD